MASLLDQIEQDIAEHEARTLTQSYVDSGVMTQADQDAIVNAVWPLVTLMLTLYGRAATASTQP